MLNQQTALITGATSGIGQACAQTLAQAGVNLIITGRRVERLQTLTAKLKTQYSIEVLPLAFDVCDEQAVLDSLTILPKPFSHIDILINNAGLAAGLDTIDKASTEDWHLMINTNLKGLIFVTKAILPQMRQRRAGHIINISSVAGHMAYSGGSVYCATKSAVRAFSKAIKKECEGMDIRVTDFAPGKVETEFSLVRFKGDQVQADAVYQDLQALSAQDIAEAILFVVSRPKHVNIAEIVIMPSQQSGQLV